MTLAEIIALHRANLAKVRVLADSIPDEDADGSSAGSGAPSDDEDEPRSDQDHYEYAIEQIGAQQTFLDELPAELESGDITMPAAIFGDYDGVPRYREWLAYYVDRFERALLQHLRTQPAVRSIIFDDTWGVSRGGFELCDCVEGSIGLESIEVSARWLEGDVVDNLALPGAINASRRFYHLRGWRYRDKGADGIDVERVKALFADHLDADRVLLIEWTDGQVLFRSNRRREVGVINTHEIADETEADGFSYVDFQAALENPDQFDLGLLYRGIMTKHIALFDRDDDAEAALAEAEVVALDHEHDDVFSFRLSDITDFNQQFDGWRLIDYAACYGDMLVVRELVRHETYTLGCTNSSGVTAVEIAIEFGTDSPEVIAELLQVPVTGKPSAEVMAFVHAYKASGFSLFGLAVMYDKPKIAKYLLELGADPVQSISQVPVELPLARALKRDGGEACARLLAGSQSHWPDGLDLASMDPSSWQHALLSKVQTQEVQLRSGNLDEVVEAIAQGEILPTWLSLDNHSAAYVAFTAKQYEVYALLRSHGHVPLDTERADMSIALLSQGERVALKAAFGRSLRSIDSSLVLFMLSKTRVLQQDPRYFEMMRRLYSDLAAIPLIRKVLQVLEAGGRPLNMVVDFNEDNVAEVTATPGISVAGSADFRAGRIYVAGRVAYTDMLGTMAHELTHQAMQCVFDNECNPFGADEDAPAGLLAAMEEARARATDSVIRRVFTVYRSADWPAESVVRVPHMLALHGEEAGKEKLRTQAPQLLDWYMAELGPACDRFVAAHSAAASGPALPELKVFEEGAEPAAASSYWSTACVVGLGCLAAGAGVAAAWYLSNSSTGKSWSWQSPVPKL